MEQEDRQLLNDRLDECLKVHADMLDAENIADQRFETYRESPEQDRRLELVKRLGQEYVRYREDVLLLEKETVYNIAPEIVKMQDAYAFLVEHYKFSPEEIESMLFLHNPLKYMARQWPNTVSEILHEELDDLVKEEIAAISDDPKPLSEKRADSLKSRLDRAAREVKEQEKKSPSALSKGMER